MTDLWASFPIDPRDRTHAGLRASDEDRERIRAELSSAFTVGKIDQEELEERLDAVASARTLGDLPPIVSDLVPPKPPRTPMLRPGRSLVGVPHEELERRARETWRERQRRAVVTFLWSAAICWTIWLTIRLGTDWGYFPWPVIVNAVTGLNVVTNAASRDAIVGKELRRLQKKQARQQHWPKGLR